MKITLLVLAAAGLASAQNLNGEPQCAVPCLQSAIASSGCALNDVACQCGSGQTKIQNLVTGCLLGACNASEVQQAASVGLGLCSAYSASLATGAGTAGSTPASAPASTTVTASTTSIAVNGTVVSGTAIVHNSTALATSAKSPGTTTTTKLTTTGGSGTGSAAGSSTSTSKGGAPTMLSGIGGVVGVVAAMVAAL